MASYVIHRVELRPKCHRRCHCLHSHLSANTSLARYGGWVRRWAIARSLARHRWWLLSEYSLCHIDIILQTYSLHFCDSVKKNRVVLSLMAPTHVSSESCTLFSFLWLYILIYIYIYIYILSDNVSKFCVYINIGLAVFPCPRSDVLLHCVRAHKLRCVFLLLQVTTGYNPCGAPEKSFDVLKHFLWALNPVYNVLKLFLWAVDVLSNSYVPCYIR